MIFFFFSDSMLFIISGQAQGWLQVIPKAEQNDGEICQGMSSSSLLLTVKHRKIENKDFLPDTTGFQVASSLPWQKHKIKQAFLPAMEWSGKCWGMGFPEG